MLQFSQFVWPLSYSVWEVFNNFLIIDATDRSKISSDQRRFFIVLSLYPHSYFASTPFKIILNFNWQENIQCCNCRRYWRVLRNDSCSSRDRWFLITLFEHTGCLRKTWQKQDNLKVVLDHWHNIRHLIVKQNLEVKFLSYSHKILLVLAFSKCGLPFMGAVYTTWDIFSFVQFIYFFFFLFSSIFYSFILFSSLLLSNFLFLFFSFFSSFIFSSLFSSFFFFFTKNCSLLFSS